MSKEIEKRWSLKNFPTKETIQEVIDIEQSYVVDTPNVTIRIRKSTLNTSSSLEIINFEHTVKYSMDGATEEREELTSSIDENIYEQLITFFNLQPINKKRFICQITKSLVAQIDYYEDGTIMVEVEFKTIKQMEDFIAPHWFGEEIIGNYGYGIDLFRRKNRRENGSK
jgi:adenylate cyclase